MCTRLSPSSSTLFLLAVAQLLNVSLVGCASDDATQKPDPAPAAEPEAPPAASASSTVDSKNDDDSDDDDDEDVLQMPKTYADMNTRLEFLCPAPVFTFDAAHSVELEGMTSFSIEGSVMRASPAIDGPLVLGVIGAVKDPSDETRQNLQRAEKAFAKAGAHAVVINGDLAEDEDLNAVFMMVGEVFQRPVLAHSGNIEWSASFNHAWEAAHDAHPQLFNMNWIRAVDFGQHTLVVMPGYFNHRFMRSGACHYEPDDVDALVPLAKAAHDKGHTVLLSSHGPPLGTEKGALDVIDEGDHVGDPKLNELVELGGITVGLFSHILESGGRATQNLAGDVLPTRVNKFSDESDQLFVNAGSASAGGWQMNNGKTNLGMAALVVVDGKKAKVKFLKLR